MEQAPIVPLKGKNLRVMCIGDSVTAGPMGTNGYRSRLIKSLHGNTLNMVGNVANWGSMQPPELNRMEGGMSKTIEDLTAEIKTSLPHWKPNVLLIHAGTNDVAWKKDLDTAIDRMQALIDIAIELCPDAAVLVALIIPVQFRDAETKGFNTPLAKIIADRAVHGQHVMAVDMFGMFEKKGHMNYMMDVAHPNEKGYELMAEVWLESLQKANGLGWVQDPVGELQER